jgi:hypothetical protein
MVFAKNEWQHSVASKSGKPRAVKKMKKFKFFSADAKNRARLQGFAEMS